MRFRKTLSMVLVAGAATATLGLMGRRARGLQVVPADRR